MNADLLQLLTCPLCRDSDLVGLDERLTDGVLECDRCGASYPVRGGVPVLLPPGFDASHVHEELDCVCQGKRQQAAYFDRQVAEEFEISRPHGTPSAYQWLMAEKLRRSVEMLPSLRNPTVVDVCCGSGMDAEFLARRGARVLALDVSEGCAARALRRAERYGVDYLVAVGDAERLPIRTDSVDIGYVHDGLHHLADPAVGLRELARVARHAVSVNEPAAAVGTRLAVHLGVSSDREEAGNRVARLHPEDVRRELTSAGFEVSARRYLMYYKHEPGRLLRFASRPVVRQAYRSTMTLANATVGRWGNKLQVTAVRAA